ncbi:MAG: hypothetical protein HYY16_19900 [Planctomycetes bacterium]|nr:hypothetical protein [Planctomycetota bacterium]
MGYEREELIHIGERFTVQSLLDWSGQVVQAARQDLARFKARGITETTLRDIETAREQLKKLSAAPVGDRHEASPLAIARREAVEAALEWREEVKGLAEAIFDSEPDVLARFRTGVKVSRSLFKLVREVGFIVGVLREHLAAFAAVGGPSLLKRGEETLKRLEEAQQRIPEERSQAPAPLAELCHAQGILYTRTRFVARIAQVEFHRDPERLARYGYAPVRQPAENTSNVRPRANRTPVTSGKG